MLDAEAERYMCECLIWSLLLSGGVILVCYEVWSVAKMLAKWERRQKR